MTLDLTSWKRVLASLERAIRRSTGSPADEELGDAVIQRFEYSYDSMAALPTRQLALLADAFEESNLPIKVDVVDLQSTSAAFRQRIAAHHEVIHSPTAPNGD